MKKKICSSLKSLKKGVGSGIGQNDGSADPDPYQNVTDPQHRFQEMLNNWSLDYVPVRSLVISFVTKLEKTFTRWASGPEVVPIRIKHQEGIVCEPLHVNNSSGSWRGFSNNRKQLASILQLRLFSFRQTDSVWRCLE
jgi:hypothetical protein